MNKASSTALFIGGTLVAWGGYFGYLHLKERPADSPVAIESAQDKARSVQEAFAAAAAVEDAEVEGFVDRLQGAVVAGDAAKVGELILVGRMLDAVEASTGKAMPAMARSMLETQLPAQLADVFDDTVVQTEITRVDRDDQGNLVVYLRQIDRDRIQIKSRWWLYPTDDGLRWWDSEDLQLGLRISTLMAVGIGVADGGDPSVQRKLEGFMAVVSRLAELDMNDGTQARRFAADLDALDTTGLPTAFQRLGLVARASAAVALGEGEDALRRLDALESEDLAPLDLPSRYFLRASACLQAGRWDEAATAAQRYLDLLGTDAETYGLLGMAELGRDDAAAALRAYDAAIEDDPLLPEAYAGVATASEDVEVVAERLRKAPDQVVLDGAAQWLVDMDAEALGRLVAAAAIAHPDWDGSGWLAKASEPSDGP